MEVTAHHDQREFTSRCKTVLTIRRGNFLKGLEYQFQSD